MSCVNYTNDGPYSGSIEISGTTCNGVTGMFYLNFGETICMDTNYPLFTCDYFKINGPCNPPTPTPTTTSTPSPTISPTQTTTVTPSPTISPTQSPTVTPTISVTPSQSPTSVTPTPTPTVSTTPNSVCPEELYVSGSTSAVVDNGTYSRKYFALGQPMQYAFQSGSTIVTGIAPDGYGYPVYEYYDGGDYNTYIMTWAFGAFAAWSVIEQNPSILTSGTLTGGYSNPVPPTYIQIGSERFPNAGQLSAFGPVSGSWYVYYPPICPTSTPTPSVTQTNTPSPSVTSTSTPAVSPTTTATNTPTPSETPPATGTTLYIYGKYINSTSAGDLEYSINSGTVQTIGPISTTSCDFITSIGGLSIGDSVEFTDSATSAIAGSTTACPSGPGGFSCQYNHSVLSSGSEFAYITVDGSNSC